MSRFVSLLSPVVVGLALLPASLHAQTAYVATGGSLTVSIAANVDKLFNQQNINVTYIGTGPVRRGETFNVDRGGVDLTSGSGSAFSQGAMTFTEGSNTVTLNAFDLLGTSPNAYITADVVVNGSDQGRFPVFLLAANLYSAPLSYGTYSSGPVRFTINPDFQSEFGDYIPINGLDPNSPLGVFSLDVTLTRKK